MKLIKRILEAIAYPFTAFWVIVDETRRENLDGEYNKYWERRNRREERRNKRKEGRK